MQQLHDRRRQRTNSPSKLACSPVPKDVKHARTFHETVCLDEMTESALSNTGALHIDSRQTTSVGYLQLHDFLQSCIPSGAPHKGLKASPPKFLEKQYRNFVVRMFLRGLVPDSVVLEAMFLINTSPLVTHCTMKDYAQFLIRKFAVPHFARGSK